MYDFFDFTIRIDTVIDTIFSVDIPMKQFLYWFTVFLFVYFLIAVTASYYLHSFPFWSYVLPLLKECTRFFFIIYCIVTNHKARLVYLWQTRHQVMLLATIALWWVVSTLVLHWSHPETFVNIAIWLKYGLYSSIIFYTAAWVGYASPLTQSDILNYIRRICTMLIYSCIAGMIWQTGKWIAPQFFYQVLWYGPLWDYAVGSAHPIYYRTGPGWYPRFSWLMSGPNNLWYLLVAYASLIPLFVQQWWWKLVYYVTVVMTLSRWAILGTGIQWLRYITMRFGHRSRYVFWAVGIIGLCAMIWLSILKGASTREHLSRTRWAIQQVIEHPRGIGLGSSWPWVHWNGSSLPENFYLQLLIDYGAIPFIGRCAYWLIIVRQTKNMIVRSKVWSVLRSYIAGFFGLLIVGLFLHVFEDSVVNYLFFIPFGLLWWHEIREFAKLRSSDYTKND